MKHSPIKLKNENKYNYDDLQLLKIDTKNKNDNNKLIDINKIKNIPLKKTKLIPINDKKKNNTKHKLPPPQSKLPLLPSLSDKNLLKNENELDDFEKGILRPSYSDMTVYIYIINQNTYSSSNYETCLSNLHINISSSSSETSLTCDRSLSPLCDVPIDNEYTKKYKEILKKESLRTKPINKSYEENTEIINILDPNNLFDNVKDDDINKLYNNTDEYEYSNYNSNIKLQPLNISPIKVLNNKDNSNSSSFYDEDTFINYDK